MVIVIVCTISAAVLIYLGHSEEGTGNWCFKDGIISFQEIFGLYRTHCLNKVLIIMPDCCYSGNWVRECAKKLDDLGIPPCGHRAREEEILIKVYASCQPYQKAAEPCFSVKGMVVDDNGTLWFSTKKLASVTQAFCGTDFTKLVCCRGPGESCRSEEVLKNWTWQDAMNGGLKSRLQIVRDKDSSGPMWHYVLLSCKDEAYKDKSGCRDDDMGYIESGRGEGPPKDLKRKINKWMSV